MVAGMCLRVCKTEYVCDSSVCVRRYSVWVCANAAVCISVYMCIRVCAVSRDHRFQIRTGMARGDFNKNILFSELNLTGVLTINPLPGYGLWNFYMI